MRVSTAKEEGKCAHCGEMINKGEPQVVLIGSYARLDKAHPKCRSKFLKSLRSEPKAAG